jgi:hypothetical protein
MAQPVISPKVGDSEPNFSKIPPARRQDRRSCFLILLKKAAGLSDLRRRYQSHSVKIDRLRRF